MATSIDIGDLWTRGVKKVKNVRARKQARRKARQFQLWEIMSRLVAVVYAADNGNCGPVSEMLDESDYEKCAKCDLKEDFGICDEDIDLAADPTCKIRFMVFRRRFRKRDVVLRRTSVRPKYVVAIRGTKPKCQQDVIDDLRHFTETLYRSPQYEVLLRMTEKVFARCKGDETVCVTGHSLGAAFGLLVAREMELQGKHVDAHLFNPPFFTLGSAAKKAVRAIVNMLPRPLREGIQAVGRGLRSVTEILSPRSLVQIGQEYKQLCTWRPHLYVNEHDIICNEYINYFERNIPQYSSGVARMSGGIAKSYHLMPSAVLHINSRVVAGNTIKRGNSSHKNDQWFKHPLEGYAVREYALLKKGSASA